MNKDFNLLGIMSQENQVKQIPVELFRPNRRHMFTPYNEEMRKDMAESIRKNGVLEPTIVRPFNENGGIVYELLAGFNRWNGCKDAEKSHCPAIIKENLTDEEAMMYMIESNLMQRGFHDLKITDRAAVIALRYSEMFSEEKLSNIRRELAELENSHSPSGNESGGSKSKMESVGNEYGLSKNSIARYVRISKLTNELKQHIDKDKLSIRAAVNLSYLTKQEQKMVSHFIDLYGIDVKRTETLREYSREEKLNDNNISLIMSGELPAKSATDKEKPIIVKFPPVMLKKYFPADTPSAEIAETIDKALEQYFDEKSKDKGAKNA